jgi:dephospho-CoA kinase
MSGTGKSAVISELAARGYKAVDVDAPGWSELVAARGHPGLSDSAPGQDWVWREDRIDHLLSTEDAPELFLSGCASNMGKFYPRFDHIVLLSAPTNVIVERLASRTTNSYGKSPDELARVLGHIETIEPLLRRVADVEIDAGAPLSDVVAGILRVLNPHER